MKTFISSLLAVAFIVPSAAAKDPHNALSDFAGRKTLSINWAAKTDARISDRKILSRTWKSSARLSMTKSIDVLYADHLTLWVVDSHGVAELELPYLGAQDFEWTDSDGYTFRIANYPMDNNHAPVNGTVSKDGKKAGTFTLYASKAKSFPVAGRWVGQVAFPGGAGLDIDLQFGDIGTDAGAGCVILPAQIGFFGHADQETSFMACKTKDGYTFNGTVFFTDERHDDRYFISFDGQHTAFDNGSEAFQGNSYIIGLSSPASSPGLFYTSRPSRFQL